MKVVFEGVPYTRSLLKYGRPEHMLPILKAIREQIGKVPGDMVEVDLKKDESERTLEIPADLAKQLKKERVLSFFENLSYTHRK